MSQPDFKIALIGECMAELSGKPFGTISQGFGGDTVNTSVYLKTLLPDIGTVSFVSGMGQDPISTAMIDKWQEYGIDTQLVLSNSEKQVGIYYIENDDSGERFFHYWRNDSAARYLMQHPKVETVFQQLREYDAVFLSGISVAILPDEDKPKLLAALVQLKQAGVKVVFDGNFRSKLWCNLEQAKDLYQQMYHLSDLALVTFDDEQDLWGDSDINECKQRLSEFDIAELVLKDGSNGCLYISQGNTLVVPTIPVKNVVDTTAAGDSFNAGFLAGWLTGCDNKFNCELGNQLAGQVIQKKGAIVDIDSGGLVSISDIANKVE